MKIKLNKNNRTKTEKLMHIFRYLVHFASVNPVRYTVGIPLFNTVPGQALYAASTF